MTNPSPSSTSRDVQQGLEPGQREELSPVEPRDEEISSVGQQAISETSVSPSDEQSFLSHHWSKFTDWISDSLPEWMMDFIDTIRCPFTDVTVVREELKDLYTQLEQLDAIYTSRKEAPPFYDTMYESMKLADQYRETHDAKHLLKELDTDSSSFGTFFNLWTSIEEKHEKIKSLDSPTSMQNITSMHDIKRSKMRLIRAMRSSVKDIYTLQQSPLTNKILEWSSKYKPVLELLKSIPNNDELNQREEFKKQLTSFVETYPNNPNNDRIQRVIDLIDAESTWIEEIRKPTAAQLPLETLQAWKNGFEELKRVNTQFDWNEPTQVNDWNQSTEMDALQEIANCFTPPLELKESPQETKSETAMPPPQDNTGPTTEIFQQIPQSSQNSNEIEEQQAINLQNEQKNEDRIRNNKRLIRECIEGMKKYRENQGDFLRKIFLLVSYLNKFKAKFSQHEELVKKADEIHKLMKELTKALKDFENSSEDIKNLIQGSQSLSEFSDRVSAERSKLEIKASLIRVAIDSLHFNLTFPDDVKIPSECADTVEQAWAPIKAVLKTENE